MNFKKYLPDSSFSRTPIKSLLSNLLNALGAKKMTMALLRKKMPNSLRVVLTAKKRIQKELASAIEKDLKIEMPIKEDLDLFNDKLNYQESMTLKGFVFSLPLIWFILLMLLAFGEEKMHQIQNKLFNKLDDLNLFGMNDHMKE